MYCICADWPIEMSMQFLEIDYQLIIPVVINKLNLHVQFILFLLFSHNINFHGSQKFMSRISYKGTRGRGFNIPSRRHIWRLEVALKWPVPLTHLLNTSVLSNCKLVTMVLYFHQAATCTSCLLLEVAGSNSLYCSTLERDSHCHTELVLLWENVWFWKRIHVNEVTMTLPFTNKQYLPLSGEI